MNKRLQLVLGIALLVCTAALVVSFFAADQYKPVAGKRIVVGTFSKTIAYAPYYAAVEKGWLGEAFAKHGVQAEFVEFQSLPAINEAMATKNLDVIFEAEIPASIGRAAGIDIKIIGITGRYYQELVLPADSAVSGYAELKGKTVIAQSGTSSHYSLAKMLEQNGLSVKDVQMIDMAPVDGKVAFESGQVDAWAVWPPFVQQEQLTGKVKTLKGKGITAIVGVRGEFAGENPALAADILEAVNRAKKWVFENPEQAQELVSKKLNLPVDVVKKAWAVHDFQSEMSQSDVPDIQSKADFLFGLKIIKSEVNATELVALKN